MSKKTRKAIVFKTGNDCPKCGIPMERRKHPTPPKTNHPYYFIEWDYCPDCRYVQLYEKYKRYTSSADQVSLSTASLF